MKHLRTVTCKPRMAQSDPTLGQILTLIGQIISVIATALVAKERQDSGA